MALELQLKRGNTIKADNYNIIMRTNDNYVLTVELGYSIVLATPRMALKDVDTDKYIDLSMYLSKNTNNTGFAINIPASVILSAGADSYLYDCVLDFGSGSKTFLFGGSASVLRGIS